MVEKTALGNTIKRGFNMAGSNGTELDLFSSFTCIGFEELYYDAPYYWGVINIKKMQIFTYTEGDTALVTCQDKESFIREAQAYIDFLINQGYSKPAYGEWEGIKKKITEN